MSGITAVQTGSGWDVDGPTTTQAMSSVDGAGNATTLVDPSGRPIGFRANKLLAAIQSARAGIGPLLIAVAGDSNTMGAGAGTGAGGLVGARRWSVGAQLAAILDRTFMSTTNDAFFGDQNCNGGGVTVQEYDPRFSAFGAGWSQDAGPTSFGGRMFIAQAGAAGALTFTPERPWNRVRIIAGMNTSSATSITGKAGGVSMGTINTRGTGNQLFDGVLSTGAPAAVQSFSLDAVTGGPGYIAGAIFWDTNNPGCVVVPGGWYGGFINQFNAAGLPWSYRSIAAALGAGLHITNMTINDANAGTAVETFKASSLAFHQAIAAASDVLITGMTPSGSPTPAFLDAYEVALQEVAASIASPFPVVDWRDQIGPTYTAANAAGWMYDGNHLKGIGYARQASVEAQIIRSCVQQA